MNRIRQPFALSLIMAALFSVPALAADEPRIRQSGTVSYVSGGVAEEGRDRILAIGRDFNLKLVFATKSGAYLSDITVGIFDVRGARLLDAKSEGPLFFVKVPPGRYRIEASYNGTEQRQSVDVVAQEQRTGDLRWND